ncbi:hypothetical protein [Pontiella sulfatireligans]|uniref:Uncharacterized protein n=1 Tax=Pontiella sulfatireligans TaxID=2750658 RepID=A0A6C2UNA5_9BACT|nr:hypothetical protein [Pontiella sulfatireligans]VGO20804.1 hypothetical protein SCARR_02871 [Pontiella sulfatireligans]
MASGNGVIGQTGYYLHYVDGPSGDHIQINKSVSPTSSGVDLRACQAAEGIYVEFIAYDVESDGIIRLALLGADGAAIWTDSVNVTAGSRFVARFLVPGLELGGSYHFKVRDEVGKWWDAPGVTVGDFGAKLKSATLAGITLTFDSVPGRAYEIQWLEELGDDWSVIKTIVCDERIDQRVGGLSVLGRSVRLL